MLRINWVLVIQFVLTDLNRPKSQYIEFEHPCLTKLKHVKE